MLQEKRRNVFSMKLLYRASIKEEMKKCGDLGVIAMNSKSTQRFIFPPPPITVRSLYKDFKQLAELEVFPR